MERKSSSLFKIFPNMKTFLGSDLNLKGNFYYCIKYAYKIAKSKYFLYIREKIDNNF